MDKSVLSMIANLEKKTGASLEAWVERVRKSGFKKHGEIVKHLKNHYGLTHGYANLVTLKARETESGFDSSDETLLSNQYKGKESLRPIYDKLVSEISKFGSDISVAPKKTYVSLRRNKQFGLIQPSTKTRLDIGIHNKTEEATDRLENSGSFNSMCSHRVRVEQIEQVDEELLLWLKVAYDKS